MAKVSKEQIERYRTVCEFEAIHTGSEAVYNQMRLAMEICDMALDSRDRDRLDWVEQNLSREGEVRSETGSDKVRTWNIVTAGPQSLRETIDTIRAKFSH